MNTKQVFKRITAVAAGATMLGATMMGALAADLSDYPDAMVADGVFDGFFVIGENAMNIDSAAALEMIGNMWYTSTGEDSTVTVEGDAWLAETTSNFLEIGEDIDAIEGYMDDSMLGALADGEISNSKGVADYEQFLYFDESNAVVDYQESDDDEVGFFYLIDDDEVFAKYVLEFKSSLESDVDENSDFDDIEDEMITLLGRTYTITGASNTSATTTVLTLMGGAVADTIEEGETATYTINDVDYEIELLSVTTTEVQFAVNGETTTKLEDSETDVLEDGTNIGITDITYQDYAGGIHSASFFLGADKLELTDASEIKVNEETIDGATVDITATFSGGDVSIDELQINMTAQDDYYLAEGALLSENSELDEPELLFSQNWDLNFAEVSSTMEDTVKIFFTEGDEQAELRFTPYGDNEIDLKLAYSPDEADDMSAGDDDDELFVLDPETEEVRDKDFFILNTDDACSSTTDAKSFVIQYRGADASTDDNPKAVLRDMASGVDHERSVAADGSFDIKLGGVTFGFVNSSAAGDDDFNVTWSTGGDDSYAETGEVATLCARTAMNNLIEISDLYVAANATGLLSDWQVNVSVDDDDKYDTTGDTVVLDVTLDMDGADGDFGTTNGITMVSDPDDDDVSYERSDYGEMYTETAPDTSGPSDFLLEMPENQAQVMLYVTSGSTSSVMTADGTLAQVQVVDASKMDSEVADVTAQNLIVVGGPCVNTVAAELLGNPANCADGFTPGVARVKWFDNSGAYAMLVAGYSGEDTRLAGRVISHRADELTGDEVEIEGTTYSDATIAAPSEVVEEEEVVEDEVVEDDVVEE